jgi:tetratricopeptide (TPR) repeat protein
VARQNRWFAGNLADTLYVLGRWDEALAIAEEQIAGEPHYMQQVAFGMRADVRLARGDLVGAAEDATAALEGSRAIRDPQALEPALALAADVALRFGDESRANALLDELAAPTRAAGVWVVPAALVYRRAGRRPSWLDLDTGAPTTPWREAGGAIVIGDLERALEIVTTTGARTYEAAIHLRLGQELVEVGDRARAEEHLDAALAFYRDVRATAFVREAEALLPAAS